MITYLIQNGLILNRLLVDNHEKNGLKGIMLRVSNGNLKAYYFIDNPELYSDVLFFGKNKAKSKIKGILGGLGLKVIPDTFKNNGLVLSNDLIKLNLGKLDYVGLF